MARTLTLRIYYLASFAVGGIYLPYFPRWLEARGVYGIRLGLISAAAPAMGIIAPTAVGAVADALGLRGGLLQLACAGALLAFASLTLAIALGVPLSFPGLLAAALAIAFFRSPMTMMADVVAVEWAASMRTTYGRLRLWGSLGFLAAAVVGGWCINPTHALALPLAATGCLVAGLLASLGLPRRSALSRGPLRPAAAGATPSFAPAARVAVRSLLAESDFRLFLVAAFLSQCGHAAYDMCFSIHLFDLGVSRAWIGVAWGLGTGAEVVLMASSARLFRSHSALSVFAVGLACAALRWVLLALVRSVPLLLLMQPMHALSFGVVWVAAVTYVSRRVPGHALATAQGMFATATGAGSVVGMLVWGPVYQVGGGPFVFAGAACFAVCASASAIALDRWVRAPALSSTAPGGRITDGSP